MSLKTDYELYLKIQKKIDKLELDIDALNVSKKNILKKFKTKLDQDYMDMKIRENAYKVVNCHLVQGQNINVCAEWLDLTPQNVYSTYKAFVKNL